MDPSTLAADREAWRAWLKRHHASAREVWLVYYKKHTGKPSVTYRESLEEALCFGWVDGIRKRIDEERYAQRFTPRRKGSRWSPLNIRLAKKLIKEGRMTKPGHAAFEARVEYDSETLESIRAEELKLAPEFEQAIRANRKAWQHFQGLAPSHRKRFVAWLMTAKLPETRAKRLRETVEVLEKGETLGLK